MLKRSAQDKVAQKDISLAQPCMRVQVTYGTKKLQLSGSASCFITEAFAKQLRAPLLTLPTPQQVKAVDGCPLSSKPIMHQTPSLHASTAEGHTDYCSFFVFVFLLLGFPWFKQPHINQDTSVKVLQIIKIWAELNFSFRIYCLLQHNQ